MPYRKSYIVKEFARNEYKSYILIEFNWINKEVTDLFVNYLNNLDMFFMYLTSFYNVKLYKQESLIILDAVQRFPQARSAVKYWIADGRYDYFEMGFLNGLFSPVSDCWRYPAGS